MELENFTEYCREHIIDHLDDWTDRTMDVSDLTYHLTEEINATGSCTCNSWLAREYIRYWWDEVVGYWRYEKDEFGENAYNPFDDPEAFMVCMVIEGVRIMLEKTEIISRDYSGKITLDEETIGTIIDQVKAVKRIEF